MTTLRTLRDDERDWANARYRELRFSPSPPGTTGVVAELGGARVGLGRLLALAPDVLELGGIWTAEAARGRGVARQVVEALLAAWPRRGQLWCIPFEHLVGFYQSCGFRPAAQPWPAAIAAKVDGCGAVHAAAVVVLARDP